MSKENRTDYLTDTGIGYVSSAMKSRRDEISNASATGDYENLKFLTRQHAREVVGYLHRWARDVLEGPSNMPGHVAGDVVKRACTAIINFNNRMLPSLEARNAPGTSILAKRYAAIVDEWRGLAAEALIIGCAEGAEAGDQHFIERVGPTLLKLAQLAANCAEDFMTQVSEDVRKSITEIVKLSTAQGQVAL